MKTLILGGAGFVGSSLARSLKELGHSVTAFDNLHRRGSEQNLTDFRSRAIEFIHGDIRQPDDLTGLPDNYDLIIEASAEPSVHAGMSGPTRYLIDTNLQGTLNALEFARARGGATVFISTSRVFSIAALRSIPLEETETRFQIKAGSIGTGLSPKGIQEIYPKVDSGHRSLYGSTKLCSEILVEEYAQSFNMPAIINRCGVLAGAGQFGRTDQGVFTLWVARHLFGGNLGYQGFGGRGKQVRDLLHPADLCELIQKQLESKNIWTGEVFNVGGGLECSVSLKEYTKLCELHTNRQCIIASRAESTPVDIPLYLTDFSKAETRLDWRPRTNPSEIVQDIANWLRREEKRLKPLFED